MSNQNSFPRLRGAGSDDTIYLRTQVFCFGTSSPHPSYSDYAHVTVWLWLRQRTVVLHGETRQGLLTTDQATLETCHEMYNTWFDACECFILRVNRQCLCTHAWKAAGFSSSKQQACNAEAALTMYRCSTCSNDSPCCHKHCEPDVRPQPHQHQVAVDKQEPSHRRRACVRRDAVEG